MNMKVIVFTAILISLPWQAFAGSKRVLSNQDCLEVYRDAFLDLREAILDYNDKSLEKAVFVSEVTGISAGIGAFRSACYFSESPSNNKCVEEYKDLYSDLRDKVKLGAVIMGNQEKIEFSSGSSNRGIFGGVFSSINEGGADLINLGRLKVIDAKCL